MMTLKRWLVVDENVGVDPQQNQKLLKQPTKLELQSLLLFQAVLFGNLVLYSISGIMLI